MLVTPVLTLGYQDVLRVADIKHALACRHQKQVPVKKTRHKAARIGVPKEARSYPGLRLDRVSLPRDSAPKKIHSAADSTPVATA